eukprot:TRINITY_DN9874_c0_g1_i2.p1 TRINITY_DN9874_c0_g1~~TRINITY_DN9874_c0_g1_i2.p1  ORF type:complete len:972 (-),score=196.84 TRINITY_DN9874_c0_g1_i2:382-3186(-)
MVPSAGGICERTAWRPERARSFGSRALRGGAGVGRTGSVRATRHGGVRVASRGAPRARCPSTEVRFRADSQQDVCDETQQSPTVDEAEFEPTPASFVANVLKWALVDYAVEEVHLLETSEFVDVECFGDIDRDGSVTDSDEEDGDTWLAATNITEEALEAAQAGMGEGALASSSVDGNVCEKTNSNVYTASSMCEAASSLSEGHLRELAKDLLSHTRPQGYSSSAISVMEDADTNETQEALWPEAVQGQLDQTNLDEIESLRLQAKDVLLKAGVDGRLMAAMSKITKQVKVSEHDVEYQHTRDKVRKELLLASIDGRLMAALAQTKNPESAETMKVLTARVDTGFLKETAVEETPEETVEDTGPSSLQLQVRALLMQAADNGQLAQSLKGTFDQGTSAVSEDPEDELSAEETAVEETPEETVEDTRPSSLQSQVWALLMQAADNGQLAQSLEGAFDHGTSAVSEDPEDELSAEFGVQVRDCLVNACHSGQLMRLLPRVPNPAPQVVGDDVEDKHAREKAIRALRATFAPDVEDDEESDGGEEEIRQMIFDSLKNRPRSAVPNLGEAMQSKPEVTPEVTPEVAIEANAETTPRIADNLPRTSLRCKLSEAPIASEKQGAPKPAEGTSRARFPTMEIEDLGPACPEPLASPMRHSKSKRRIIGGIVRGPSQAELAVASHGHPQLARSEGLPSPPESPIRRHQRLRSQQDGMPASRFKATLGLRGVPAPAFQMDCGSPQRNDAKFGVPARNSSLTRGYDALGAQIFTLQDDGSRSPAQSRVNRRPPTPALTIVEGRLRGVQSASALMMDLGTDAQGSLASKVGASRSTTVVRFAAQEDHGAFAEDIEPTSPVPPVSSRTVARDGSRKQLVTSWAMSSQTFSQGTTQVTKMGPKVFAKGGTLPKSASTSMLPALNTSNSIGCIAWSMQNARNQNRLLF